MALDLAAWGVGTWGDGTWGAGTWVLRDPDPEPVTRAEFTVYAPRRVEIDVHAPRRLELES